MDIFFPPSFSICSKPFTEFLWLIIGNYQHTLTGMSYPLMLYPLICTFCTSLWKIFHKRGPNDYPCGQPLVIFFQVLTAESGLTRFNPLAKYDIINWSDSVETSHSLRLFIMSGGFKESNALLMSVERTPAYRFSSTVSFQSSLSFITVFLQLWFLTKKLQVL